MISQSGELGRYTANSWAHEGTGRLSLISIKEVEGEGEIELDSGLCHGKKLYVQEAEVCVDGVTKYALVVMSEPYSDKLT